MNCDPNSIEWRGAFSAFPAVNNDGTVNRDGLSKRELFAAMAMQGILSNLDALRFNGFKTEEIAPFAVMQADALLVELARAAK